MLEVGNGKLSLRVARPLRHVVHAGGAPDRRQRHPQYGRGHRDILTNKEVIAIDQDPLGRQASRVRKEGDKEVWASELEGGSRAVALLNRAATPQEITVKWEERRIPRAPFRRTPRGVAA